MSVYILCCDQFGIRCVAGYEENNVKKPIVLLGSGDGNNGESPVDELKAVLPENHVAYGYIRMVGNFCPSVCVCARACVSAFVCGCVKVCVYRCFRPNIFYFLILCVSMFGHTQTDVVDEIPTVKFVYIQWIGEATKIMAKAQVATHKGSVEDAFNVSTIPDNTTQHATLIPCITLAP